MTSIKDLSEMDYVLFPFLQKHCNVIHVEKNGFSQKTEERYAHGTLKGSACVDKSEWSFLVCIGSPFDPERCLKPIFGGNQ